MSDPSTKLAAQSYPVFPIGVPGIPWGLPERQLWRSLQTKKRDYAHDVVEAVNSMVAADADLRDLSEVINYGTLDYSSYSFAVYSLVALKSRLWNPLLPAVIITGGVHGYETSGVHGALLFIQRCFVKYARQGLNIVVLPCVSPWGYETINRWNPEAIDPNRCFNPLAPGCSEARMAMECLRAVINEGTVLMHLDLHETTDTDNSEFIPAKAARDGSASEKWSAIPDGFYLVGDSERGDRQLSFLTHMIDAVRLLTHIAEADEDGMLVGEPLTKEGIVCCPDAPLMLCALHTSAAYVATTEVYPDSAKTTRDLCNLAQVACVSSGLDYVRAALTVSN